jgi:hypothetical protein
MLVIASVLAWFVASSFRERAPESAPVNDAPGARDAPPAGAAVMVFSPVPQDETIAVPSSLAPGLEFGTEPLAWERRLEVVTHARDIDEVAKARQLLDMLPSLPEEALEPATREAVSRLADEEYAAAQSRLINPNTHGMVLSVLFEDLLERPDEITLPTLLTIARMPSHPFATQARDDLELLLEKNFDADWVQWGAEIRRVLSMQH